MSGEPKNKRFISANTIAAMLEVHPASVRQGFGRFGSLTRYKIGRRVRYDLAEVEALIQPESRASDERTRAGHAKHLRLVDRRHRGRLQ
jgi:NADH/NAD ratio-sensing transcriptional regulator Rex